MKSNDGLQNLTETALPKSDDRFARELAGWFDLHRALWSGTAAELLASVRTEVDVTNDLWPKPPSALYSYLEAHEQILRSLGVAVLLPQGFPRMILLRSCHDEGLARKPPSSTSGSNETFRQDISVVHLDADEDNPERVCDDTLGGLFAMLNLVANLQIRSKPHNVGMSNRRGAGVSPEVARTTPDQGAGRDVGVQSGSRTLLGRFRQRLRSLLIRKKPKKVEES